MVDRAGHGSRESAAVLQGEVDAGSGRAGADRDRRPRPLRPAGNAGQAVEDLLHVTFPGPPARHQLAGSRKVAPGRETVAEAGVQAPAVRPGGSDRLAALRQHVDLHPADGGATELLRHLARDRPSALQNEVDPARRGPRRHGDWRAECRIPVAERWPVAVELADVGHTSRAGVRLVRRSDEVSPGGETRVGQVVAATRRVAGDEEPSVLGIDVDRKRGNARPVRRIGHAPGDPAAPLERDVDSVPPRSSDELDRRGETQPAAVPVRSAGARDPVPHLVEVTVEVDGAHGVGSGREVPPSRPAPVVSRVDLEDGVAARRMHRDPDAGKPPARARIGDLAREARAGVKLEADSTRRGRRRHGDWRSAARPPRGLSVVEL